MSKQKELAGGAAEGRPLSCPSCGSPRVARILYGLTAFDKELEEALSQGTVTLGGCLVTGDDPEWECLQCGHTIHASPKRQDRGQKPDRRARRPRRAAKRAGR
jgi:ribosomal protein L37AE/L43A